MFKDIPYIVINFAGQHIAVLFAYKKVVFDNTSLGGPVKIYSYPRGGCAQWT